MSYDIIGDIHGQADKLEALLRRMGYQEKAGCWRHPGRTAILVGDFIDRGPYQLRSVTTARRMVEAGAALAVMGNHELNAIAWHTPDPDDHGEYLRPHFSDKWGEKNRKQHERFLAEVENQPEVHREVVEWFLTLPLWLDLPGIRVVHACWHPKFMEWLSPQLSDANTLGLDLLPGATREPDDEAEKDNATPSIFKAVEALTKGIEIPLPPGLIMTTEKSPTLTAENSPTLVKVFYWVLGRDRCRGRGETEGARRATVVSPLPRETQQYRLFSS